MSTFIWLWFYRLQQARVSINAAFYYFVTLQFRKSMASLYILYHMLVNTCIIFPLFFLSCVILRLIAIINKQAKEKYIDIIQNHTVSKENAKKEYLELKDLLLRTNE